MAPTAAHLRIALAGLLGLAVAMGVGRFAFTPLLPLMQEDQLLTVADGGLLASVHFLGYFLGALLAAKMTFPPRQTLWFSLLAIGVSTLGMGLTKSFTLWLIFRGLSGGCSAFALVLISNYAVRRLAEAGQARMQGWVFSGVGAGITVAGLGTLALMAVDIGSMPCWQIMGAASLAVGAAACILMGRDIPGNLAAADDQAARRTPLEWSVILAYGAAGIGYIIPATYLPVMARETVQSPLIFGWAWPVFGLAAFLSTLLSARLHAFFSNRQIWIASQLVMATGLLLPAFYPHIVTIITAGICVGGTFMIITMAGMKEAHRIAAVFDVRRHIAILTTAFATGQMIGPVFGGWAFEATGSFSPALVVTSIALAVSAFGLAPRSRRKEFVRS